MKPEGWAEVELGSCATFFKGSGLAKSDLRESGTESCIHYGELFTFYGPVIRQVESKCDQSVKAPRSQRGDVLMPGSDVTPRGLATASAVMVDGVVLGGDVIAIRPAVATLCGPFLAYIIRARKEQVLRLAKGSTVYHIHARDLSGLEIPLPPLAEQQAIAEALSDADALVESLDALIAKKRDMKQAAMQQLLTGRTRLPGFADEWVEGFLGQHASFEKGAGLPKSELIENGTEECIHYGELFTQYGVLITDVLGRCMPFAGACRSESGDVLMPGSDVTPRGLATASAVMVDGVILGGDVIVIRPVSKTLWGPFFASLIRLSKGSVLRLVKGSTVYHIHAKDLAELSVSLPSVGEQKAIAEVLSDMDAEIDALVAQREKAELVKQGMMQELLSGRVRPA